MKNNAKNLMRLVLTLTIFFFISKNINAQDLYQISMEGSEDYKKAVQEILYPTDPKMVGGVRALKGQFPWQVSLDVSWSADLVRAHFCGGSIINDSWILTAAHCVEKNTPRDIIVSAGHTDLTKPVDRVNVQTIYIKKSFVSTQGGGDIALLKLLRPLRIGENIQVIKLLENLNGIDDSSLFTITGWGAISQNGPKSKHLLFIEKVQYISSADCKKLAAVKEYIKDGMICAGFLLEGKGPCQGDSGGPKVIYVDGEPKLSGIVSWGEGCAQPKRPNVYTDVSYFHDWITSCISNPANTQCDHK
jgi:secreted trypsin-like serine protease